jgi:hypothetical protein
LLPYFGSGQIESIEGRVEAGVANHMEAGLDTQKRTRRKMGGRLGRGKLPGAPLPRRVSIIGAQGSRP